MAKKPENPFTFWEELKRRKVIRVIIGYLAASYVILELASIVTEPLGLPGWTINMLIILIVAGFIIVAILSWIFDFTPGGIKKTGSARSTKAGAQQPTPARRLRTSNIIIAILLVAVCILAYPRIFRGDKFKDIRDNKGIISVAVLPFDNMTGNTSLDYFNEGISSMITNGLGNSQELAVIDDQTMFELVESFDPVTRAQVMPVRTRDVAERAKSQTYITGSFHGREPNYWIIASLYDTRRNEILRTFRVEGNLESSGYIGMADQLCREIRDFLEVKVLEERSDFEFREVYPGSSEAYRYFIDGMKQILSKDYLPAIESMKRALEIDSTFTFAAFYIAFANNYKFPQDYIQSRLWTERAYSTRERLPLKYQNWVSLWHVCYESKEKNDIIAACNLIEASGTQSRFVWFDLGSTYYSWLKEYDKTVSAFEKIEQIDKERGSNWEFQEYYYRYGRCLHFYGDHKKEMEIYELGLSLPHDITLARDIYWGQAVCALTQGDTIAVNNFITSYLNVKREIGDPPYNIMGNLGLMYYTADMMSEALEYYRKASELNPQRWFYRYRIASALIDGNIDVEQGLQMVENELAVMPDNETLRWLKGKALYKMGMYDEALIIFRRIRDEKPDYNYEINRDISFVEEAIAGIKSNQN